MVDFDGAIVQVLPPHHPPLLVFCSLEGDVLLAMDLSFIESTHSTMWPRLGCVQWPSPCMGHASTLDAPPRSSRTRLGRCLPPAGLESPQERGVIAQNGARVPRSRAKHQFCFGRSRTMNEFWEQYDSLERRWGDNGPRRAFGYGSAGGLLTPFFVGL